MKQWLLIGIPTVIAGVLGFTLVRLFVTSFARGEFVAEIVFIIPTMMLISAIGSAFIERSAKKQHKILIGICTFAVATIVLIQCIASTIKGRHEGLVMAGVWVTRIAFLISMIAAGFLLIPRNTSAYKTIAGVMVAVLGLLLLLIYS